MKTDHTVKREPVRIINVDEIAKKENRHKFKRVGSEDYLQDEIAEKTEEEIEAEAEQKRKDLEDFFNYANDSNIKNNNKTLKELAGYELDHSVPKYEGVNYLKRSEDSGELDSIRDTRKMENKNE